GDTYQKLTGHQIILDPAGESGTDDGAFTVYVRPGVYTVGESDDVLPSNTRKITGETNNAEDNTLSLAAGESGTAGFYNRECLGSITITKKGRKTGESDALLSGAAFTLYRDGREVARGETDGSGHLCFDRLPYGEYTVRETEVPDG